MSFFFPRKTEYRNANQVLSGGWYQWEGGRYKERVWESEYGGNITYSGKKKEK
jgi:hypothetical protein